MTRKKNSKAKDPLDDLFKECEVTVFSEANRLILQAYEAPLSDRGEIVSQIASIATRGNELDFDKIVRALVAYDICDRKSFVSKVDKARKALTMETTPHQHKCSSPTDSEMGDRFLDQEHDLVYAMGNFRRYNCGAWEIVQDEEIIKGIDDLLSSVKGEGYRSNLSCVKSVFGLVKIRCYRPDIEWDADPNLLVCGNKAIELLNMVVREHRREDYVTTRLPYNYDPNATAPAWMSVLARLESDLEKSSSIIMEFAGLSLTGLTAFERCLALCGAPGRGKSTVLLGLTTLVGDRGAKLDFRDLENSRFALHPIVGRTFLYSFDQKIGRFRGTDIFNRIVSGEPVTVEIKCKTSFEYSPFAKLAFATNALPVLENRYDGFGRRAIIIPFDKVQPFENDIWIKDRIRAEGPGILNLALENLPRLLERGHFEEDQEWAIDARMEFQGEADPFVKFSKLCNLGQGYKEQAEILQLTFGAFRSGAGHPPIGETEVVDLLKARGIERYEANGKRYYRGIQLKRNRDKISPDDQGSTDSFAVSIEEVI